MDYYRDSKINFDDGDFVWSIWFDPETMLVTFAETVEAIDEETYISYGVREIPDWIQDIVEEL